MRFRTLDELIAERTRLLRVVRADDGEMGLLSSQGVLSREDDEMLAEGVMQMLRDVEVEIAERTGQTLSHEES